MSHPDPSHDRSNEYPDDDYTPSKRKHPRPLSSIAKRKGKGSQLSNLVQGWKHQLMSPRQKAIDKAKRRNDQKNK
jgi:hypothetical protein